MPSITRRRNSNSGRRDSVVSDVVAATERLLAAGASFTELGVQQISAEAGVARSTFYAHFGDKTALMVRLAEAMRDTVFTVAAPWEPADGPDALTDVYAKLLAAYREHAAVLRAIAEVATYDATVRDVWGSALARFVDHTTSLIRTEQAAGRTPPEVDPGSAARLIIIGGERVLFDHAMAGDHTADEAIARTLALAWWHGVYRRPLVSSPASRS